jgi:hypothetical protein
MRGLHTPACAGASVLPLRRLPCRHASTAATSLRPVRSACAGRQRHGALPRMPSPTSCLCLRTRGGIVSSRGGGSQSAGGRRARAQVPGASGRRRRPGRFARRALPLCPRCPSRTRPAPPDASAEPGLQSSAPSSPCPGSSAWAHRGSPRTPAHTCHASPARPARRRAPPQPRRGVHGPRASTGRRTADRVDRRRPNDRRNRRRLCPDAPRRRRHTGRRLHRRSGPLIRPRP